MIRETSFPTPKTLSSSFQNWYNQLTWTNRLPPRHCYQLVSTKLLSFLAVSVVPGKFLQLFFSVHFYFISIFIFIYIVNFFFQNLIKYFNHVFHSHTMGKNRKNDRKIPFSQSTWTGNIWTQRWWIVLHSTGNTLQLAVQAKIISSVDFKFPAFHFFIHRESFFFPPKQSHGQVEQTKPKNQPISANQSPLPPHKELH